ncbi:MAG: hypothetical protein HZB98_13850 [Bacteroidia bacterium]|nr:hypothetical protein [Bacteroidia bacterium]
MSGTIFKYIKKHIVIVLLVINSISVFGHNEPGYRALKLTLGGGYGYYFNTFTNVFDEDVKNSRPSFYGKLMWQPEHRLGIGIESGNYEIYSTTRIESLSKIQKLTTSLNVIPLFLSLSMKTTKHLDLNIGTGAAIMNYEVIVNKSKKNRIEGQSFSLSNFTSGFTLHISLGDRLEFGSEFKYLFLGKTNDSHISAFLNFSYKIVNREIK